MSARSTPNFVLLDTDHQRISGLIVDWVPGFEDMPEYSSLGDQARRDPVAVRSALGRLLARLQGNDLRGGLEGFEAKVLESIYKALERLAERREASIRDAVASDVLGTLKSAADSEVRVFVKSQLGPRSRALYE